MTTPLQCFQWQSSQMSAWRLTLWFPYRHLCNISKWHDILAGLTYYLVITACTWFYNLTDMMWNYANFMRLGPKRIMSGILIKSSWKTASSLELWQTGIDLKARLHTMGSHEGFLASSRRRVLVYFKFGFGTIFSIQSFVFTQPQNFNCFLPKVP